MLAASASGWTNEAFTATERMDEALTPKLGRCCTASWVAAELLVRI